MASRVLSSARARRGGRLPDFLLVGAPKAGTTALHAALAQHPELFLSPVKEPKYYLCGDSPPPAYTGPGDAHSNREWVWQRQRYLDLFEDAARRPAGRREHAVLPLPPRRPAPDRRGPAEGQAGRRPARPGRPGLLQLAAPLGGRARAVRRRAARLRPRAGARRRRLGAVLALPLARACTAASSTTSSGTSTATGSCCCATASWWRSRPRRSTGSARFLGVSQGVLDEVPAGNSRPVRAARACAPASSAPWCAPAPASAPTSRPSTGAPSAVPSSTSSTGAATRPAHG